MEIVKRKPIVKEELHYYLVCDYCGKEHPDELGVEVSDYPIGWSGVRTKADHGCYTVTVMCEDCKPQNINYEKLKEERRYECR